MMGLRTALLLTVAFLVSSSYGKLHREKRSASSVLVADGTKSMELVMAKSAFMREPSKQVIKGPPCDKKFSWTYIRPGTSTTIRSRWLGKAMNFPDICGWSFWTDKIRHRVSITCDSVDIRDTDYLTAWDYDRSEEIGNWQGVTIENFEIDLASQNVAFILESSQVRDKRSFECTVAAVYAHCGKGNNIGKFDCGDGTCISLDKRCDTVNDCSTTDAADEAEDICIAGAPCSGDFWYPCDSGRCIAFTKICDGTDTCTDGSDEGGCGLDLCDPGQILCYVHCLNAIELCDDVDTCGEEPFCTATSCALGYFRCDNGTCMRDHIVCDGTDDCINGDDEDGCYFFVE